MKRSGIRCRLALIHDLRSPLNLIIGYSEMLIEQAREQGQEDFVPDLEKTRAAGKQLLALINNNFHPIRAIDRPVAAAAPIEAPPLLLEQELVTEAFSTSAAIGELASGAVKGFLLIVDDLEANRDVLSRRLRRQGYWSRPPKMGAWLSKRCGRSVSTWCCSTS